jgi:hypothetical protein
MKVALESSLDVLFAKDAIRELVLAYCRGADRGDLALMRSLYEEGAADEHGVNPSKTAAEFLDMAPELRKGYDSFQHHITNHAIRVDGDVAEGEAYLLAYHWTNKGEEAEVRVLYGRFLDRYSRRTGQWRFAHRKLVRDWVHEYTAPAMPLVDGPVALGRIDARDPSYAFFTHFSLGPAEA